MLNTDSGKRGAPSGGEESPRERRAWKGVTVLLAAAAIAVGAVLSGGNESDPHRSAAVTLNTLGNAVVPFTPGQLPTPPSYTPDPGPFQTHCQEWKSWLQQHRAASWTGPNIDIAAPSNGPVTVLAVQAEVFRAYRPHALTLIECEQGAGGLSPAELTLDLTRPAKAPVLRTGQRGRIGPLPPSVFVVPRGVGRTLSLAPHGRQGLLYEWGIRIETVFDQRRQSVALGSREHPIRTWFGRLPQPVDYDLRTGRWRHLGFRYR